MAVNDVIADIDAILTGANLDFQPAAGVEIVLTSFGSDLTTADEIFIRQTDGVLFASVVSLFIDSSRAGVFKIFINNTIFINRLNTEAGTRNVSFSGIQTK